MNSTSFARMKSFTLGLAEIQPGEMMRNGILALGLAFGCVAGAWAGDKPGNEWVGTWAASPVNVSPKSDEPVSDSTYRNIVHVSLGGSAVRVQLTNEFGAAPLKVGAAHIGAGASTGAVTAGTDHALTFGGRPTVEIPKGGFVVSDPVPMEVAALSDLAVSVYLPEQEVAASTCHSFAASTNYISKGDTTSAATVPDDAKKTYSWCFVKGIDVRAKDKKARAVVMFGDSITDGALSTRDANSRWPDLLAARLHANKKTANVAVLNQGIGGNRVLHDGYGPSAIARFDRDVLAQSGVKYLVILESINDIGRIAKPKEPGDEITAQDLIFGFSQLVTRAHQHGIKVYGATLTPYEGAGYFSAAGEQVRTAVNEWIRTGGVLDGVIDFDKATLDPAKPTWFSPSADSGDHLHPKDAGYKAMADSIDLGLFK